MPETLDQMQSLLKQAGASWIGYGPTVDGSATGTETDAARQPVELADHFGAYEAEYAAIRQRVGIMAQPQRAVVRVTGADRKDYLHRMVTQNVLSLGSGESTRAFQLGDKGRIVADMLIHHGDEDTWLEMDRFDVPALIELLDARLFAEDVTLENWTDRRTALGVYGPAAQALLERLATDPDADEEPGDGQSSTIHAAATKPGTHHVVGLAGQPVTVYRRDELGVMGLHLLAESDHGPPLVQGLLEQAGYESDAPDPRQAPDAAAEAAERRRHSLRGRPVGWAAYNTARIEAGTPIFHIDFGPDSLPPEAGEAVVDQAIAFDKGCFLGQEIVARIRNLGHPKRVITGLQFPDERMPVAGTQVLEMPAEEAGLEAPAGQSQVIGGVTSSTVSALLGNRAIALATMKWSHHQPGTEVRLAIEGEFFPAEVCDPHFLH